MNSFSWCLRPLFGDRAACWQTDFTQSPPFSISQDPGVFFFNFIYLILFCFLAVLVVFFYLVHVINYHCNFIGDPTFLRECPAAHTCSIKCRAFTYYESSREKKKQNRHAQYSYVSDNVRVITIIIICKRPGRACVVWNIIILRKTIKQYYYYYSCYRYLDDSARVTSLCFGECRNGKYIIDYTSPSSVPVVPTTVSYTKTFSYACVCVCVFKCWFCNV